MKYFLQFFALWPGHNNNFFFHFYALLSITSLIFQFYNVSDVFDNLELLSMNISNIIMILAIFLKTAISWRKRRYMKNVLIKMMDDWYQIKNPEQLIIMKNHVKFSHTFFVNAFIAYNFTILLFPIFALRIYFTESVENRLLPLLAKFPFSNKTSPIYEIIYILQAILLIFAGNAFVVLDTSYAAMILHAVSKLEIIRFELENFVNNILKSEKKSTVKVLFEKYHEVTKFVNRIDEIFSLQLFFYFILAS
ncbi:uncharacterized protein LOC127277152, partial [Leptopilina boulardi]|uniref:uncharacterized protein LOC127277152 n=1 Tax=Leptopilina boulardi TaxID=63433 RepID=UPI0021F5F658